MKEELKRKILDKTTTEKLLENYFKMIDHLVSQKEHQDHILPGYAKEETEVTKLLKEVTGMEISELIE